MESQLILNGSLSARGVIASIASEEKSIGTHSAMAHCGEILQGVFFDKTGHLHRGLITLPCPSLSTTADFEPAGEKISVFPPSKTKAAAAARRTLAHLGLDGYGGKLTLSSNIPIGLGMGSSTSDIVSTINAVANAFRKRLSPETVAKLSVESEVASDSIMFTETIVLFAQREGVVLEHVGAQLPPLSIVCVNTAPAQTVDTVSFPPARYTAWEMEAFRSLLAMARKAILTGDASLIGRVASASARINQRFLPKPMFSEIERIAADTGAVGIQVAHSGTVAGLMFDAQNPNVEELVHRASGALAKIDMPPFMQFLTREAEYRYAC
ncbi:GHMP family kinase ATP-binding protein [Neorhizobium alkalisoli]|uniref:GHMP family kinase ATP-binding protein n=1 Tax=Neorhizobium alkalisoli TaxID=528178 RepID=UPI000CF92E59|nr:hypothetical protein [Neorhizobium alkalisoli]